jgi:hypothetical protein
MAGDKGEMVQVDDPQTKNHPGEAKLMEMNRMAAEQELILLGISEQKGKVQ